MEVVRRIIIASCTIQMDYQMHIIKSCLTVYHMHICNSITIHHLHIIYNMRIFQTLSNIRRLYHLFLQLIPCNDSSRIIIKFHRNCRKKQGKTIERLAVVHLYILVCSMIHSISCATPNVNQLLNYWPKANHIM